MVCMCCHADGKPFSTICPMSKASLRMKIIIGKTSENGKITRSP